MSICERNRIRAILGPTNIGKTWFTLDRMIGPPLRLLVRKNCDQVVTMRGRDSAAPITGEGKILTPPPHWFTCTVEPLPPNRPGATRRLYISNLKSLKGEPAGISAEAGTRRIEAGRS